MQLICDRCRQMFDKWLRCHFASQTPSIWPNVPHLTPSWPVIVWICGICLQRCVSQWFSTTDPFWIHCGLVWVTFGPFSLLIVWTCGLCLHNCSSHRFSTLVPVDIRLGPLRVSVGPFLFWIVWFYQLFLLKNLSNLLPLIFLNNLKTHGIF